MSTLRVLQLVKTSVGATWAYRQMRELVKLGVEVHVAAPAGGPLIPQYEAAGVHVHTTDTDFPIRRPHRWPVVRARMRALVDDVKPDIIHSHFVGTTLSMRIALGKSHPTPRIFQVPGPLHLENPLIRRGELATAGPRDYWIGSCLWTCDAYAHAGIPRERIGLAYYGTDVDRFQRGAPGALRRELKLSTDTKIVGMVAFMYAPKHYLGHTRGLKGHEDLIDAIGMLADEGEKVMCVMVGGPWAGAVAYEQRLHEYARKHAPDHVVFLGTRSDIPDLYSDMDLAVHPSHSENVGGAVESLLLAVPTIATNVGGFPDLVRPGDTGWLVPSKDPAALARTIRHALHHPDEARTFAQRGCELARDMFDVKNNARDVFEFYQRLA